jgi:hypothetical protein
VPGQRTSKEFQDYIVEPGSQSDLNTTTEDSFSIATDDSDSDSPRLLERQELPLDSPTPFQAATGRVTRNRAQREQIEVPEHDLVPTSCLARKKKP